MIILCHWLTLSTGRVQLSDRYLKPVIPDFVDVNVDALKHAQVLGDLQQPVLPDNFDELSADKKQVGNQGGFIKPQANLRLRPALYAVLRLQQMKDLPRAIYYSSLSCSDDSALLERCLMSLSAAYGDYIPVSAKYPVCPVSYLAKAREGV